MYICLLPMNISDSEKISQKCFIKRFSGNIQQIYRKTTVRQSKHGCSPVNLLNTLRTSLYKNNSGGILIKNINRNVCLHLRLYTWIINQHLKVFHETLLLTFSIFCLSFLFKLLSSKNFILCSKQKVYLYQTVYGV